MAWPTSDPLAPPSSAPIADAAMARYADGDAAAFALVYDELAPRLRYFLRRRCSDAERAEDVLQSTFLAMHRARGRFEPGSPVLPWCFAIARRLAIDDARRASRRPEAPEAEAASGDPRPDAAADLQARRLAADLAVELTALPVTQREAFELVRIDGFTLEEAAMAVGASIASMKARSHRAQETLRARLWRLIDA